jgi:hypothetical protein
VVAGLRLHVTSEELTGRLVVVVLNLKPAKLAGELSEAVSWQMHSAALSVLGSLLQLHNRELT